MPVRPYNLAPSNGSNAQVAFGNSSTRPPLLGFCLRVNDEMESGNPGPRLHNRILILHGEGTAGLGYQHSGFGQVSPSLVNHAEGGRSEGPLILRQWTARLPYMARAWELDSNA